MLSLSLLLLLSLSLSLLLSLLLLLLLLLLLSLLQKPLPLLLRSQSMAQGKRPFSAVSVRAALAARNQQFALRSRKNQKLCATGKCRRNMTSRTGPSSKVCAYRCPS